MMALSRELRSKIRGCVLGTVLGDAIGGPFEFGPLERVPALTGGDWIDGLYPYPTEMGSPHGRMPMPRRHALRRLLGRALTTRA
jgi:ADP-ribosylglycohydrolase